VLLPCPSCKAELSAALVGADGRCPYCGTKAAEPAFEPAPAPAKRPRAIELDPDDTVPAPRASASAQAEPAATVEPPVVSGSGVESALPPGWGGLSIGARGILAGKPASMPGRLRFRVERPRTISWWDAWAVRFSDGGEGWLLDREGALAVLRPYKLPEPIEFDSLREGQMIRFERSAPATVVDLGTAVVRGAEGKTDLQQGARVRYATLAGDSWRYHFQWADGLPFEAHRGEILDPSMLAAGFALRAPSGFRSSVASSFEWFTQMPTLLQITLVLLAIPAIAGLAIVLIFDLVARLLK
jgi:hypothetical protein